MMTNTSRQRILQQLRASTTPRTAPIPTVAIDAIRFDDTVSTFVERLQGVGGTALRVSRYDEIGKQLEQLPFFRDARTIGSTLGHQVERVTLRLDEIDDPCQLEDLDVFIAEGDMAVAENGAIWVTDQSMRHRAAYFIAQHLIITVREESVVDNLHLAYEQLAVDANVFGAWISGPSKTADIEQSLVIGAQGARSLTAIVIGPEN